MRPAEANEAPASDDDGGQTGSVACRTAWAAFPVGAFPVGLDRRAEARRRQERTALNDTPSLAHECSDIMQGVKARQGQ